MTSCFRSISMASDLSEREVTLTFQFSDQQPLPVERAAKWKVSNGSGGHILHRREPPALPVHRLSEPRPETAVLPGPGHGQWAFHSTRHIHSSLRDHAHGPAGSCWWVQVFSALRIVYKVFHQVRIIPFPLIYYSDIYICAKFWERKKVFITFLCQVKNAWHVLFFSPCLSSLSPCCCCGFLFSFFFNNWISFTVCKSDQCIGKDSCFVWIIWKKKPKQAWFDCLLSTFNLRQ